MTPSASTATQPETSDRKTEALTATLPASRTCIHPCQTSTHLVIDRSPSAGSSSVRCLPPRFRTHEPTPSISSWNPGRDTRARDRHCEAISPAVSRQFDRSYSLSCFDSSSDRTPAAPRHAVSTSHTATLRVCPPQTSDEPLPLSTSPPTTSSPLLSRPRSPSRTCRWRPTLQMWSLQRAHQPPRTYDYSWGCSFPVSPGCTCTPLGWGTPLHIASTHSLRSLGRNDTLRGVCAGGQSQGAPFARDDTGETTQPVSLTSTGCRFHTFSAYSLMARSEEK